MRFALIRRRKRQQLREIAAKHYVECNGDVDAAFAAAEKEIRTGSIIVSILIGLAVRLIWELMKHWLFSGVTDPGNEFLAGEPGA